MNRELKFRAWDGANKRMMTFDKFWTCDEYQSLAWWINKDKGSYCLGLDEEALDIMQFTGLKDKNGRDIYEGDILSNRQVIKYGWHSDAEGYQEYLGFNIYINRNNSSTWERSDELEVIGNIFENPELLTEPEYCPFTAAELAYLKKLLKESNV